MNIQKNVYRKKQEKRLYNLRIMIDRRENGGVGQGIVFAVACKTRVAGDWFTLTASVLRLTNRKHNVFCLLRLVDYCRRT